MATFESIIEKYSKTSRNHKKRSGKTFSSYFRKYMLSKQVWSIVEENGKDRYVKIEARKNYIVNIVTALEVFIKDTIRNNSFPIERQKELLKDKVTLWEAHELFKSNGIRTEAIIADYYSFQNLDVINRVLSTLYNNKILVEIDNTDLFTEAEHKDLSIKTGRPNWKQELIDLFEIRHDSIHDINFTKVIGKKKTNELGISALAFAMSLDMFVFNNWVKEAEESGRNL